MSILKYSALIKTLESQSLTKAATAMGYTQPGISHMISSLEEEMGFPLIIRSKKGVYPTENANALLHYMYQIITAEEAIQQTVNQIRGIESGSIRIASFNSTSTKWLPAIISEFNTLHPNITITIIEQTLGDICQSLQEGAVDIAFTSTPIDTTCDFFPLYNDPIVVVLSDRHPLAEKQLIDPADLAHCDFIVPESGADESIYDVLNAEKIKPTLKYVVRGDSATLSMIKANLGITLLPQLVINPVEGLTIRPLSKPYSRELGIAVPSIDQCSPAVRAFFEVAKKYIEFY